MNPGAQTFPLSVSRTSEGVSWGFRLTGGADFDAPVSIAMVNPGSPAEQFGVKAGDAVLQINGQATETLSHDEAKYLILRSALQLQLLLQRGEVTIWKPTVTPAANLANIRPTGPVTAPYGDEEPYVQKTSLAANKQPFLNIGGSHNRTARGFQGFGGGDSSAAPAPGPPAGGPAYAQPTAPAYGAPPPAQSYGQPPAPTYGQQPAYGGGSSPGGYQPQQQFGAPPSGGSDSGGGGLAGFRSVRAPIDKPPSERKEAQYMTCKACGALCVGVFVRISGDPFHPECFKCVTCGKNLKNQGYFNVGGKMYCDVHAAAATPTDPDMVPVPVYR